MVVKQVIVVRRDLNMNIGKASAQISHASMAFMSSRIRDEEPEFSEEEREWIEGIFRKVVLGVDSEEELHEITKKAEEAGLTTYLIKDAGLTVFKEPTYTCVCLGPHDASKIDPITGHLKLL